MGDSNPPFVPYNMNNIVTKIQEKIVEETEIAQLVSNHTRPEDPEAWRRDNNAGRRVQWLEDLLATAERINKSIEELDCEGDWCGKSPHGTYGTRGYSDGLCSVCRLHKNIFVNKLAGK